MGYLPNITASEMVASSSARHYRMLMERSASARGRGDHQTAQQFATAAHKWAMDEHVRLQQLVQAQDALVSVARHLKVAWDKDPTCETFDELREYHPELRRLIMAWEQARTAVFRLSQR